MASITRKKIMKKRKCWSPLEPREGQGTDLSDFGINRRFLGQGRPLRAAESQGCSEHP